MEGKKKVNFLFVGILMLMLIYVLTVSLYRIKNYRFLKSEKLSEIISYVSIKSNTFLFHNYRYPENFDELIYYINSDHFDVLDTLRMLKERYSFSLLCDSADNKFRIVSLGSNKMIDSVYVWIDSLSFADYLFADKDILFYETGNNDSLCGRMKFHPLLVTENGVVKDERLVREMSSVINDFLRMNLITTDFDSYNSKTTT